MDYTYDIWCLVYPPIVLYIQVIPFNFSTYSYCDKTVRGFKLAAHSIYAGVTRVLRHLWRCIPAHFRAPPTSAQRPICLWMEVHFYWKVTFARGLFVVRHVRGCPLFGRSIPYGNSSWSIDCCPLYSRCPILRASINGCSSLEPFCLVPAKVTASFWKH